MPIKVDEDFLNRASKVNDTIATNVLASPNGDIKGIVLTAGYNYPLGKDVNAAVANAGAQLQQRLTEIHDTASKRSTQLKMFLLMSDDTEDLNDLTAKDFFTNTPAWNTGGK
jgi:hypothetical protein